MQTVLPILIKAGLDASLIAEKLAINPRKILNLPIPSVKVGETANFTIYNATQEWEYNSTTNFSKSANSPLLGKTLKGKVNLVYNNNQFYKNEQ